MPGNGGAPVGERPDLHRLGRADRLGGVAIFPGDVVVADDDGAFVIPQALVGDVIEAATEQERFEAWVSPRCVEVSLC